MTNYIEQLMKAAGVEPEKRFKECKENAKYKGLCTKYPCIECESSFFVDKYPDFIPEKQLELIKLIMKSGNIDNTHQYYYEISKMFVFECRSLPELGTYNQWSTQNVNYELALAELVLVLISENELDKSEVKRILEGDKNYS